MFVLGSKIDSSVHPLFASTADCDALLHGKCVNDVCDDEETKSTLPSFTSDIGDVLDLRLYR